MVRSHTAYLRLVTEAAPRVEPKRQRSPRRRARLQSALEAASEHALSTVDAHVSEPLRTMVAEHLETGGKRIRANIALQAAAALGIDPHAVVEVAAACELLHNATLVHDDLQDGDTVRRGQPTVWVRHGEAQAINVGDVMLMLPTLALETSALEPAVRWHIASAFARRSAETAAGQSLELALLERRWLGRDTYLRAALGKSGPFFALPIEAAALCAGMDAARARDIGDATLVLGALFQVRDDILDLFGDKGRGQSGNDLREGKISALTVAHLAVCPDDEDALFDLLSRSREETTQAEVDYWSERFMERGALAGACRMAAELVRGLADDPVLAHELGLGSLIKATAHTIIEPLATVAQ